ncbi:MAG: Na+/H+ antiporter subunit E [Burkholderiales bacterium]|nr:Na+/H+ antiporter subunit E [Burkholderiales bacterium]
MRPGAAALSLVQLTLFWLLLANTLDAGQIVLGLVLSAAVLWLTRPFAESRLRIRRPAVAAKLAGLFLYDIVVANLAVARAVLSPGLPIQPRFLRVPLELTDPGAAALLAGMVTLTPGTVSVDLDLDARTLTVHALLGQDEAATVDSIKRRYEARIREIFQC